MSNIRSLSDLKKDGGRGNAPPGGNSGMPPSGGGGLGGMFSGLGGLMGMGGPQGGGSHDEGKNIKFLHKDGQLAEELKKAGGKLVVIDFTASWCGPCKMIAPHFKQMSEKYTNVVFLKIDVDECQDTAQACGIRAMPTFQFYKNSKKIDEFSGASPDKLQNLIEKHQGSSSGSSSSGDGGSFSGSGYVLGGSKSSSTSQSADSSQPSTTTPQTTTSAPAPKEGADPVLLTQLVEMGFSKEHCEKALVATGNRDIEGALNWIEAHPETASTSASSQPTASTNSTTSTTSTNEATTSTSTSSSAPKKIDPMDIDLDDDEEHFIIEEEKNREQRVLTPEEIEMEKRKLQERLAAIRARKAEQEKQAEIEREKTRIKEGKAAIEAKKEWEQKQLEREAAKKEREKEEDRKAKAKLQALLEQDKRERAARLGKTAEPAKQTQAPAPKPAEPAPKKEYTEALVQIRLLDGSTIKATFKPTDPLRTVHNHVALLMNNDRFTLNTNFPRKQYSPRDSSLDTTTLQQAECVPNGTFVVQKLL